MITCVDYVILAVIIFLSMRGNKMVKYYFGFLDGDISKSFFLLFCALLVWPINITDVDNDGISGIIVFLKVLSGALVVVAVT